MGHEKRGYAHVWREGMCACVWGRNKNNVAMSLKVYDIPYSGFISREKIFVNGWHLCISRIKFLRIAIISATPPESEQASASGRNARM